MENIQNFVKILRKIFLVRILIFNHLLFHFILKTLLKFEKKEENEEMLKILKSLMSSNVDSIANGSDFKESEKASQCTYRELFYQLCHLAMMCFTSC